MPKDPIQPSSVGPGTDAPLQLPDIDPDNAMHKTVYRNLMNYHAGQKMWDSHGRMLSGNKAVRIELDDGSATMMHRETFNELGGMDAVRERIPGATVIHGARLFQSKSEDPWVEKS